MVLQCDYGGTGIRGGLKIRLPYMAVLVRVQLVAPILDWRLYEEVRAFLDNYLCSLPYVYNLADISLASG